MGVLRHWQVNFQKSGDIGVFLVPTRRLVDLLSFEINRIRYPMPTRGGRTHRGKLLINIDLLFQGVRIGISLAA